MEEVDKIIIDSLRHLHCDLDEEITTLKSFTPDTVVAAISSCLETINPQVKLPKKLPSSMSARIKFASSLAQQIKEFGFRGDMGYQTILYCNEVEVRRVLMFLIERLPKECSPVSAVEPMGYVPRIVKQIEETLRDSLARVWIPSDFLRYKKSHPLECVDLSLEEGSPVVTQQCSARQLIPSLLFHSDKLICENYEALLADSSISHRYSQKVVDKIAESTSPVKSIHDKEEAQIEDLLTVLRDKKDALVGLQHSINEAEQTLSRLKIQEKQEQEFLKDSVAKVKVKNRTLAVLQNDENKVKLKNLVHKAENRLVELANQWNEVKTPLLEEHRTLKSSISPENLKDERNRLKHLKKTYRELVVDYKEKKGLEKSLMERCKELNNKNSRAAYTKRIMEIVGNIKKQNKDIQKVLADTRLVQKEINNLTGQIDRSFLVSDELIFHDCQQDEAARKAYKLLAALREESNGILQVVTDLGQAERDLRNMEEQVEVETSKGIKEKLEKVQSDLYEIQKEVQAI